MYAVKRTTTIKNEGGADILKQEWVVIDWKMQEEAEDNYNNMQRQKMTKYALYRKNGTVMFIVLYGQLHSDIVTIAKRSITPLFETVNKERDVVGLLSILCSICLQNLTGSKVDPYLEQLKILSSTLSYVQKKGISNHNFSNAVHDQIFAVQSQCSAFVFKENYHVKMLCGDGISNLKDYFSFDQTKKDKYDTLARELVCARLIINNSLFSKTCIYLREQYVVNQSNFPDTVVEAVAMITLFGNDDTGREKGNNNTNKTPEGIISIHLANYGNNCSNNDDGSVA